MWSHYKVTLRVMYDGCKSHLLSVTFTCCITIAGTLCLCFVLDPVQSIVVENNGTKWLLNMGYMVI